MLRASLAALAVFAVASPARADRMAPLASPVERALRAPVVVVGTVTAVEKDAVDAPLYPGAANKVAHRIAVVKVEAALAGAGGLTHLKVGFVTPAAERAAGIRSGRGPNNPELKDGQEWLFFLTRNADGDFHAIPYMTPPVESAAKDYAAQVAAVKAALAAVADPAKALRAEKADDRFRAAVAIVYQSRVPPEGSRGAVEPVALAADESRAVLAALAGGAWAADRAGGAPTGYRAFAMLGLGAADGWTPPAGVAGEDFAETTRAAFAKWLAGPGKDYRVKKLVPKKAEK